MKNRRKPYDRLVIIAFLSPTCTKSPMTALCVASMSPEYKPYTVYSATERIKRQSKDTSCETRLQSQPLTNGRLVIEAATGSGDEVDNMRRGRQNIGKMSIYCRATMKYKQERRRTPPPSVGMVTWKFFRLTCQRRGP